MDKNSTFRTNLVKRRKALGLTQEQLAARLNVSPQAVSKWENSSYPDGELLPRLAKELNISLDSLFGVKVMDSERDIEQLIDDEMRSVPEEKRSELFMKMMYTALCACNPNKDTVGRLRTSFEHETFAGLKTDRELALSRLNTDLRYFCFLEIPEKGVNSYFGDTTNMVRLFNTLADDDAISIISYLGASVRNKMFSVAMISEKLDIPSEKVQHIIDRLDRFGLVWRVSADINDQPVILYGYTHHTSLTLILVLAKTITNYLKYMDPNVELWERGAFRRENGEQDEIVPQVPWWKEGEL
ncbi:Transcriptional regulator, contains XRE-family HTH domain [Ruminococcus flavefaciens]|uniref:Transcriptional regulator, contains XRE-family HTH domain n=1 Tax=Ruminococcus flavefaciens TaxID=1265 RepID=A0A1H6I6V0_RUMFL|nr:helix-turn-helix transcriptional regulator [Ruminococcus flavefaciens]SEH42566.1 Transcriptional regulator, contains XRE-family HTH domain [Ruminococcus flavefaciens]